MNTQFEEKGKIFTPVITKHPIEVVIQTIHHRIIGKVHIRPSDRLIDELNKAERFVAITEAKVFQLETPAEISFESEFITVNCDQIIWIVPTDEIHQG